MCFSNGSAHASEDASTAKMDIPLVHLFTARVRPDSSSNTLSRGEILFAIDLCSVEIRWQLVILVYSLIRAV